jgi:hypothetical protein
MIDNPYGGLNMRVLHPGPVILSLHQKMLIQEAASRIPPQVREDFLSLVFKHLERLKHVGDNDVEDTISYILGLVTANIRNRHPHQVSLHTFLDEWADQIRSLQLHPSGRSVVLRYLFEMHIAVQQGNMAEFRRLIHLCREKVAQELSWA